MLALVLSACGADHGAAPTHESTTTTTGAGDPVSAPTVSLLFTVQGASGTAATDGTGWDIAVSVPSGRMLEFSDRPVRSAEHIDIADFVGAWSSVGFGGDPPNATITGRSSTGDEVNLAVELTNPHWDTTTSTLSASASPIGADTDATLPESFDQVSLFVDDGLGSCNAADPNNC